MPITLPHRQVQLDFHTAPDIPDVGRDFDPAAFAATMRAAHVDSVTLFAKCHHGFSYHPTAVGTMHPSLGFDLLGAQIEALHEAGIRAPIYISVGWDELMAEVHPEWRQVDAHGRMVGRGPRDARGWRLMDLASPYAEYVLAQTEDVLRRYHPVDGLFFDIVMQEPGADYAAARQAAMRRDGVDEGDPGAVQAWAAEVERRFIARASALVRQYSPDATIFFNSRLRLDRDPAGGLRPELASYTHVEIESLPTAAWGYNHYPLFAAHFQTLGLPLVGMTGIFHRSWGDFGSLKPEAALQYECARIVASGGACSVGDQLHPRGVLELAKYRRLGAVYGRLAALEPWLEGAEPLAEIGVLLAEAGPREEAARQASDEGALRMLLELHRPFQFLDAEADVSRYAAVIAPDDVPFSPALAAQLAAYLADGGALLLTHRAGLTPAGDRFALDIGAEHLGDAPFSPDYFVAGEALGAPLAAYPQALYERGSRVRALPGAEVLARVGEPYFNRSATHFMSHEHAPYARTGDDPAVIQRGRVIYCHSPLFSAYRAHAVPFYRQVVDALLARLAPAPLVLAPGLPTTAEVALLRQPGHGGRLLVHLIHAVPQRRAERLDLVEDVLPLRDVQLGVRAGAVRQVALAPSGAVLPHETDDRGVTWVIVPEVRGHQVVVFTPAA